MSISNTFQDWRDRVWNRWLEDRRRLSGSGMQPPSLFHHHGIWSQQRRLLKKNPDAYRRGEGIIVPVKRGEISKIDWELLREQAGTKMGEKLYAGFETRCPEVYVPDHHQRRYPGTPVWVDNGTTDKPLYRWNRISDNGELMSRDELLSIYDPGMFGEVRETFPTWDAFNSLLDMGTSIYDRNRPHGEEELALAILEDLLGEHVARDLYKLFTRDIVSELPHIELQIRGGVLDDPNHFTRYAEWHLSEKEIRTWVHAQ